ncbi:ABC transporter ATP-binding protein [Limnovirga soli]|uniref:ATP-binding cassette domain-containing protein n=1 Tax=Limnovirga soli TaxID=2656915 RepID=A0A8J8FGZ6_9BACT|nr:ATP-binding cassette domain-containing protein [Limnovirga soli]NNV57956.1 ATP-binding cassette domain-containing protein [Limnovirga soli]
MINCVLHKQLHAANGDMQLHVSFKLAPGDFISIYGPSGAGKTSIIRMLAGFLKPDDGEIHFEGETWFSHHQKIHLAPQKRNIGFVFQDYALFPNMTVRENLLFALQKNEPVDIIAELMQVTGLEQLSNRQVQALSGGQKQRLALARALVRKPKLLLLDEPLSAVDNAMRESLQTILKDIHIRYNLTTVLVSHDISEIIKLANRTLVIENGIIIKEGNPADIFFPEKPHNQLLVNGQITEIVKTENGQMASVLLPPQIIKVELAENEVDHFQKGDLVQVSHQKFNPTIKKIEP